MFRFREVPAARDISLYTISDDRTLAGVASAFVPASPEQAEGISIPLEATYIIEAVFTDDDGVPVPNARLYICPVGYYGDISGAGWHVTTGEGGSYVADGIVRGLEYHLWVRAPRTASISDDVPQNLSRTVVLVE